MLIVKERCWPWDVAASWAILLEAGGAVFNANAPDDDDGHSPLADGELAGRLYLALRPCAADDGSTVRQSHERVARAFWKRTERLSV